MQGVTPSRQAVHAIGQLCVGGDWACAHGDLSALREISLQLAEHVAEPLHCALVQLADACYSDPERAVALWTQLKECVYQDRATRPRG